MVYTLATDLLMATILAASAFLCVFAFIKRNLYTLGKQSEMLFALIPYALCCAAFRVLYDLGMTEYSSSPLKFGFYVIGFGMLASIPLSFMFAIRFSIWLGKSTNSDSLLIFKRIGYRIAIPTLAFLAGMLAFPGRVFAALILAGLLWLGLLILTFPFEKLFGIGPEEKYSTLAKAVILTQAVDASATYAILSAMPGAFVEEHFIPRVLIGFFGPWSFFLLKAAFVLIALWLIARVLDGLDERLATSAAQFLVCLGIVTGVRNLVLLGMA